MKISQINTSHNKIRMNKSLNFKQNDDYFVKRKSYINSHSKDFEDLTSVLALCTISSEIFSKNDVLGREKKIGKLPVFILIATGLSLLATCIKKYQLGKDYDIKNKNQE